MPPWLIFTTETRRAQRNTELIWTGLELFSVNLCDLYASVVNFATETSELKYGHKVQSVPPRAQRTDVFNGIFYVKKSTTGVLCIFVVFVVT